MATFREFLRSNNIAFIKRTASGNGLNMLNESGVQLATVILNQETPENEDILGWAKAHMDYSCKVNGNFITLAKVEVGVSISSLWDEPKATSKKKVKG